MKTEKKREKKEKERQEIFLTTLNSQGQRQNTQETTFNLAKNIELVLPFAEAVPLKNILAKNLVVYLTKMFTVCGNPKEIKLDRGTNITSNLFTKVLTELGIKQSCQVPVTLNDKVPLRDGINFEKL